MTGCSRPPADRGQSNVVGVALLLGITVVALGVLTASIGFAVDSGTGAADAARVGDDVDDALRPVEVTGEHVGSVRATDGQLRTVGRDVRVLNDSGIVAHLEADALVYETDGQRVTFLAGGVVRGEGSGARLVADPPVVASPDGDVLVVGVATLGADRRTVSFAGEPVRLRTNVTHDRRALGSGEYRLAIETETPAAWRSYFRDLGATVTDRDIDGDGVDSVVATFPDERTAYLVVHALHLEVGDA
jgi:flagellin-like protein